MAYTPTQWVTGDTVTATKLNKLEQGVANAGGGGYDAEVHIYHDNNPAHNDEITIESGTFSALASKIKDGITPTILVKVFDDLNGIKGSAFAFIYDYNTSGSVPYITLNVFIVRGTSGSTLLGHGYTYISWSADDEVTM